MSIKLVAVDIDGTLLNSKREVTPEVYTAIQDAKKQGRKGLVLTCKDKLIPFYQKFGFVNEGISKSVHGNVVWNQMRLLF